MRTRSTLTSTLTSTLHLVDVVDTDPVCLRAVVQTKGLARGPRCWRRQVTGRDPSYKRIVLPLTQSG